MEDKPKKGWVIVIRKKNNLYQYRCYDIKTNDCLFTNTLKNCTKNVAEFIGTVHALAERDKRKLDHYIFIDSFTVVMWVNGAYCNTSFPYNKNTESVHKLISNAVLWLKKNRKPYLLLKWKNSKWGDYSLKNN